MSAIKWLLTSCMWVVAPRLASGDHVGRVVVWDVGSAAVIAMLEDALVTAHGRRGEATARSAVAALAWVTANTHTLAVAIASGTLLLWNSKGPSDSEVLFRHVSACRAVSARVNSSVVFRGTSGRSLAEDQRMAMRSVDDTGAAPNTWSVSKLGNHLSACCCSIGFLHMHI